MSYKDPKIIHWTYLENWGPDITKLAPRAACYSITFNETKPTSWQKPYEFEETVYIGESSGHYFDTLGSKSKKVRYRTNTHSRIANHYMNLVNGNRDISSYNEIISKYGYGKEAYNGIITGKPAWLCLMIPKDEIIESAIKSWAMYMEADMLMSYQMKWGKAPIGNINRMPKDRVKDSKSSELLSSLQKHNLEEFLNVPH